jgi:hypothetical protein
MSTANPNSPASPAAPPARAVTQAGNGQEPTVTVEKKKKKKKYSRGLPKLGQKAEVSVTKGIRRLARAVEEGLGEWRERSSASARKQRDGALRDAVKNYGKAVTKLHKVAAKVPEDLSKAIPSLRRVFRR